MRLLLLIPSRLFALCLSRAGLLVQSIFWRLAALAAQLGIFWAFVQVVVVLVEQLGNPPEQVMGVSYAVDQALLLIAVVLVCAPLRFVAIKQAAQTDAMMGSALGRSLRMELMTAVFDAGASFESVVSPERLVRLSSEAVLAFERFVGGYLSQFITHLAATILVSAYLSWFLPSAAIPIMVGNLVMLIVLHGMLAMVTKVQDAYLNAYDEVGESFARAMEGLVTLKVYGATMRVRKEIAQKNAEVAKHTLNLLKMQLLSIALFDLLIFGSCACAAYLALSSYAAEQVTLASGALVCLSVTVLVMPARTLVQQFHQAMLGLSCGRSIAVTLDQLDRLASQLPWHRTQGNRCDNKTGATHQTCGDNATCFQDVPAGEGGAAVEHIPAGEGGAAVEGGMAGKQGAAVEGGVAGEQEATVEGGMAGELGKSVDNGALTTNKTKNKASSEHERTAEHATFPSIVCKQVTVSYSPHGSPVLKDCTCSIEGAGFVVIVGASGSGKSTLLRTIMRQIQPLSAQCLEINGHELAAYQPQDLTDQLAFMDAHAHIFAGSLRQNLTLYGPASDEAIYLALGQVNLLEMAKARGGLDAVVDPKGANFSGGQRQRIACARTFLSTAPIVLLDEPTSSVDQESEEIIVHAMRQQGYRRLVLCVTHNVTYARQADQVLVMDQGRVVASGAHDDLIQTCLAYRALWEAHGQLMDAVQDGRGGAAYGL